MVRYFLRKPNLTDYHKWQLIADLLDCLEEDYLTEFPDEVPIFAKGFKETLRKLVIPK